MATEVEDPVVCTTTPWYIRRMLLMFLMFAFFAAWFYRDYRWGYPAQKERYDEYQRIMAGPGGQEEWKELTGARGWDLAAPDKRTDDDIVQQKQFAIGCAVVAAAILGTFLFNRRKTLRADADGFHTPSGDHVPFDSVFRVDRRKWKHKGLAAVYYRDKSGAEKKAVIDDLKYAGADRILDRVMNRFRGEVIDLEEVTPAADDSTGAPPASPAAS